MLDPGDDTPIVVVNGKVLMDLDLGALLRRHRESGAEATMVLRQDEDMSRWGTPLHMDREDGRLVSLLGETLQDARPGPPMMFTGVHVFQPRFLDRIPPEGEQCVIRTAYHELFREGGVFAHETKAYWWEHSTPERYLQGVANVLDGRARLEYAPGPLRGVDPRAEVDDSATIVDPVWIGPGARVGAGATVGPHVQLGAGARVAAGVSVRRSILWEGAGATEDLEDRVIPA
jgi:NDP-sugar pyrophosphorylase family protein